MKFYEKVHLITFAEIIKYENICWSFALIFAGFDFFGVFLPSKSFQNNSKTALQNKQMAQNKQRKTVEMPQN